MISHEHALVVFSGGQDSTTCLIQAKKIYPKVSAVTFSYGQRHNAETTAAAYIAREYDIPLHLINLPCMSVSSALLRAGDINAQHVHNSALPASYVPGRNAIFLTMAHALAQELHADTIITGVCETDYSGYPDCRRKFIDKLEDALNEGYQTKIKIETPLMYMNKADIFALARSLGALATILVDTLTCYEGNYNTQNHWGRGCGECSACLLRKKGFEKFEDSFGKGDEGC